MPSDRQSTLVTTLKDDGEESNKISIRVRADEAEQADYYDCT